MVLDKLVAPQSHAFRPFRAVRAVHLTSGDVCLSPQRSNLVKPLQLTLAVVETYGSHVRVLRSTMPYNKDQWNFAGAPSSGEGRLLNGHRPFLAHVFLP